MSLPILAGFVFVLALIAVVSVAGLALCRALRISLDVQRRDLERRRRDMERSRP